jgi:hypothetical protein
MFPGVNSTYRFRFDIQYAAIAIVRDRKIVISASTQGGVRLLFDGEGRFGVRSCRIPFRGRPLRKESKLPEG